MKHRIAEKLKQCNRGATLIEYALLASLLAMAIISSVSVMGAQVGQTFFVAGDTLGTAVQNPGN